MPWCTQALVDPTTAINKGSHGLCESRVSCQDLGAGCGVAAKKSPNVSLTRFLLSSCSVGLHFLTEEFVLFYFLFLIYK